MHLFRDDNKIEGGLHMSSQKLKVLEDIGASHNRGETRTQKAYTYSKTISNKPKSKESYKIINHCSSKILRL